MNSSEKNTASQKHERMHQLALTMYRTGELSAALKIWKRLKENNPDFPDIDRWIKQASKPPYPASKTKPETDPTVFRTQRELMSQYGTTPRRRQFKPKTSSFSTVKRFRHRHVVYVFLIFFLFCSLLSIRNNRSFLVQLNPMTEDLDCYQGTLFPFGWQQIKELKVGIDENWTNIFKDKKLINRLKKGIQVHSLNRFDDLIIEIYMTLGNQALERMTIRSQQSAIYYFKQIERASFGNLVKEKLAKAFINLSGMMLDDGDQEYALKYFQEARKYDHTHPDIFALDARIGKIETPKTYF